MRIPWILVALCSAALAATSAPPAPPDPSQFPIPTREERERTRKPPAPRAEPGATADADAKDATVAAAQDDFDVTRYLLDVEFTPSTRVVGGAVTITATSRVAGFREVILDLLDNMTVTSVTRGATPLAFTHQDNLVRITLDRTFNAGQSFEVKVSYNGKPAATGFGSIGWNKYFFVGQGKMVWTLSEPEGARTWWPCKDKPADKAQVEEWWTVPATWTATGNGTLIATETLPNSRKRFKWKPARPLTTYLVSIAATDYVSFSDTYTALDGTTTMPVTYYVYSEDLTPARESFRNTPAMIAFYAETFGEYPFLEDKYGMSAFPWSGAMEHTTNTSYGYLLIDGGHGNDYVIAHELAHQWWGDSVSPEEWNDVWLNEGFASYSEALWAEHLGGADTYRDYMNSFWRSSFDGTLYAPNDLFGTTVYDKGAWAVHMLRGVMGDGPFFLGLRDWYASRRDATGNTAQLQATMEARHGAPLGWYFQEWVYGPGMPAYEVGWTTADLGGGAYRNWVRIRQTQVDAGPFTMPVRLTLVTASGSELRTVWNDALDQDFTLDTAEPLIDLVFDERDWILKAGETPVELADADGDGVPDRNDNCASVVNPVQQDFDGDALGDACDEDDDGDAVADALDCAPFDAAQGTPGEIGGVSVAALSPASVRLAWLPATAADLYDVSRGALSTLRSGGGYGACRATGLTTTALDDDAPAAAGDGWQWLVRGRDTGCGGAGPFGAYAGSGSDPAGCP